MKKFIKPLLLITFVVILAVLIILPKKTYAVVLPGLVGPSRFGGVACWCPVWEQLYNCTCNGPFVPVQ